MYSQYTLFYLIIAYIRRTSVFNIFVVNILYVIYILII